MLMQFTDTLYGSLAFGRNFGINIYFGPSEQKGGKEKSKKSEEAFLLISTYNEVIIFLSFLLLVNKL